jgi:NAD(P)-dependent dehydrogenase (short-subunit alcohol dehydrogenase family)
VSRIRRAGKKASRAYAGIPLGRAGDPATWGAAALLVSEQAQEIAGAGLPLNGGA